MLDVISPSPAPAYLQSQRHRHHHNLRPPTDSPPNIDPLQCVLKLERQLRRLQERVPDVVADAIDDIVDATGPSSGSRYLPPTGVQTYGPQIEGPDNAVKQPFFQYSQCSGKKKALLVSTTSRDRLYIMNDGFWYRSV